MKNRWRWWLVAGVVVLGVAIAALIAVGREVEAQRQLRDDAESNARIRDFVRKINAIGR